MPTGFADGLQTNFRYVTVKQVRAAGIPESGEFGIDDARLNRLIVEMCHWINRLTDQWFLPVRLRERVDGSRGSVARMPNLVPILELFSLDLEKEGLFAFQLPSVAYQIKQRYVMMLSRGARLPELPHFVVLNGVFGWLVDTTRIVKTRTTAPIVAGATSIPATSTAHIRPGDTILVGRDPEPRVSIIQDDSVLRLKSGGIIVDGVPTATTIPVEPVEFDIPEVGVPIVRYGRVPDMIQRAALLMIRDRVQKIGDIDTAESPFGIGTRLNSESVEGYSYSLGALPAMNGHAGGSWTTGNVEVDDILQQFCTPAMYIGNV
jgi:hypothetical protein